MEYVFAFKVNHVALGPALADNARLRMAWFGNISVNLAKVIAWRERVTRRRDIEGVSVWFKIFL